MSQTLALFKDAYRELNARKLFWVVLALSGLVVAAFAMVGINERGITFLWMEFDSLLNTNLIAPNLLYKYIFASLAIPFWLGWIATILALVSTAGIFPDFVSSGSIELVLSKPIGRTRLFLTKYLTGLLFVALQVTVFTVAAFMVLGWRGGAWEPALFWAVPIMVGFYSYLFAPCALLGLLTRSTVASLLLTLLLWFAIFGVHSAESIFLGLRIQNDLRIETLERRIATEAEQTTGQVATDGVASPDNPDSPAPAGESPALARRREQLVKAQKNSDWIATTHRSLFAAKTLLPKTNETVALLGRTLLKPEDQDLITRGGRERPRATMPGDDVRVDVGELERRLNEAVRSRSVAWVVGTSLAFEAVVMALAVWIFRRRDF